jgi:hypothetical protein
MRSLGVLSGCLLALAVTVPSARGQEPDAEITPLLASVRESERAGLAARLEVDHLGELPLYDLHLAVDDEGSLGDLGTDAMSHVRARIVVPAGMQVAATGIELASAPVRDPAGRAPRREVTIGAALVRDFAVLVSGELVTAERDVGGVRVRSWFLARERAAGERVLDVAASALAIFVRRFGPYPYPELDVVEAPLVGGAGGIEFSGLVTVASMFYRPSGMGALAPMLGGAGSSPSATSGSGGLEDGMLEFVTAHEVAHQWWHGIVGSDSRRHPWVDESLAQYSAMLYLEDRYGTTRAQEEGERHVEMNFHAMRMMGQPDAAVDRPTSAFGAPVTYAGLVYGKGPYLYPAIRAAIGDDAFFAGLRGYVERYRYRIAPGRGPIESLATGAHASRVRALARHWLDETHGDADLGASDPGAMLGAMLPPELRDQMRDPAMRAMFEQLMRAMAGGAGGGSAEGMPDLSSLLGGLGGGGLSPEQLQRILGSLPRSSSR